MWTIVYILFLYITLISVNRQGIFIFSNCLEIFWSTYTIKNIFIYKYFDSPTDQKIHIYIFCFILFLHFYIQPSKKWFECSEKFLFSEYIFWKNMFEKFFYIIFTWNQLNDILISRIIQANIWYFDINMEKQELYS